MSTKARLGIDITAVDKTRAAFAAANRNLTGFTSNVRRTIGDINKLRTVFAAAFVGLGVRAAVEAIGRSVDKNLVDKAGDMQSRWKTTWDAWGNTADRLITEAAMGLDGLITDSGKALGLIDQIAQQSVNRSGMGSRIMPDAGATYGKGLPNNVTDMTKTVQAFQSVNTLTKESVIGYKELAVAKEKANAADRETWSFQKNILQGLDEQIAILQVEKEAYGQSAFAIDALVERQRALNEAVAAGHPLSQQDITLLDEKISMIRALGAEMDALRQHEEDLKNQQQAIQDIAAPFKSAFSGIVQAIAEGSNVAKAFKDQLAQLSQRLIQMATDKLFEIALNLLLPGSGTAASTGISALLSSFGGGFAKGGNLSAGKWGIAGEGGEPELIEGPARITPMSKLSGGKTQINVHNYGNDNVSVKESSWGDQRRVDFYIGNKAQQATMPKQLKRR